MADTITLIGGDTLLGREVREVFGESSLGGQLRLVAADEEETGKLTEIDGAAAFLAKLDPDAVEDAAIIVLAGTAKSSREAMAANSSGLVIDLTYETEDDPDARVRAPQVEGGAYEPDHSGPQVVAHPAATAIAIVLDRLNKLYPIAASIVHVFEPASERGKAAIDELQQQTVSLLAFKDMPKKVFDAQASFAMLAQLGENAEPKLHEVEERIERHLATLLDRTEGVPMPSLRLIQAPVFHGYSMSLWIEFEDAPPAPELEEALAGDFIDVRGAPLEAPTNIGVVGQSGVSVGAIVPDRNNGNAVWMWMAADNFRLAAESAAMIAREAI
ncbi:MAG: Asd/ArgC dimerization domain-containing protein [Acidobacteriota bacterium]